MAQVPKQLQDDFSMQQALVESLRQDFKDPSNGPSARRIKKLIEERDEIDTKIRQARLDIEKGPKLLIEAEEKLKKLALQVRSHRDEKLRKVLKLREQLAAAENQLLLMEQTNDTEA